MDMSNKTSDKNVAKVTKSDIDILNALIYVYESRLQNYNELMDSEVSAIKHVLAEREQDKKQLREYWNNNLELANKIKELERYTIHLTDEQYRKVIENAQMDTSNDRVIAHKFAVMQKQIDEKDKRIQELEELIETKQKFIIMASELIENSIPKQVVKDKIDEIKETLTHYNEYTRLNVLEKVNVDLLDARIEILQELLEGEK